MLSGPSHLLPNILVGDFGIGDQYPSLCDNISVSMTVCIAAIADKGNKLILAADNMLTIPVGNSIQYQKEDTEHKKIHKLNNTSYALAAGNSGPIDSILYEARKNIKVNMNPDRVALEVKEAFQKYHQTAIEDSILKKFNLTYDYFIKEQKKLDPLFIKDLVDKINSYIASEHIIIVGFSKDTKTAYIGTIAYFTLYDRTAEHFFANGIGADLAKFSLILSNYSISLPLEESKNLIKKAVEDARKTAGVGPLGDFIIIDNDNNVVNESTV